jgi:PAS domain-containing protein
MPVRHDDGSILWNGYFLTLRRAKKTDEWIKFLNTALMNISDSVIITDQRGEVVYANRRTKELHGYEPEKARQDGGRFYRPMPRKTK